MKLLVIEDDTKVARALARGLREEGFAVDVVTDGDAGLVEALHGAPDAVLLDVALPGRDGWSVLEAMRAAGSTTPVLMLTARDDVVDKVKGLALGADDYVVKPFAFAEVVARTRALLRRGQASGESVMLYADLAHDTRTGVTTRGEAEIELTRREAMLLVLLLRHKREILSRSYIAEHIWDFTFDGDSNVLDTSIWRLRKKIDGTFSRKLIHTIRGRGYVLR